MSEPSIAEPRAPARVVVVGAGITGLACFWRLRQLGVEVRCLEASERAGGAVQTGIRRGLVVEEGPTTVQGAPELLRLVREVGLEDERIEAAPGLTRYVLRGGKLHALPRSPAGFLTCGVISAAGKARVLAEAAIPPRRDAAEESVEQFFARRFGPEVVDALVAPFVSGTFAGDPARLSARSVFPALVDLEERSGSVIRGTLFGLGAGRPSAPLTSLRGGFEELTRRLVEKAGDRLALASRVEHVRRASADARGFVLEGYDHGGARRWSADTVVIAVSAWQAAALLAEVAPQASRALDAIEAPPLAIVNLAWKQSEIAHPLDGFGFLVARGEPVSILGCVWPASIFATRASADGRVVLTTFVGGARDPARASLDDAPLIDAVGGDLGRILGAQGEPEVLSITRYRRSIPQYTIGHARRIECVRAGLADVPGLFVGGNFVSGISVGECVRQGFETAGDVYRSRK